MDKQRIVVRGSVSFLGNNGFKTTDLLGKKHTILPAVMMVEGSYYPAVSSHNSPSSLFFSSSELKHSVNTWNGRPVSVNHPDRTDTCNDPGTFDRQWIGYVFNTRFDDKRRSLKGDMWIDNERGSFVTNMVRNGKRIDVSIGALGDVLSSGGRENYDYFMKNIVGDHLAVLPDSVGACSWEDGCGVRAEAYTLKPKGTEERGAIKVSGMADVISPPAAPDLAIRTVARGPAFSGTEDIPWNDVDYSLDAYIDGYYDFSGLAKPEGVSSSDISNLPQAAKDWIATKSLLGDQSSTEANGLVFLPVVNPKTNKLNEGALRSIISEESIGNDVGTAALASARTKAESLLRDKFNSEDRIVDMAECDKKIDEVVDRIGDRLGAAVDRVSERSAPAVQANVQAAQVETVQEPVKKASDVFDYEKWLDSAPGHVRDQVIAAVDERQKTKEKHIKNIVSCKSYAFCEKKLGKIDDIEVLEGISTIVNELNAEPPKEPTVDSNYQLKNLSASRPGENLSYAPIKKIAYGD
jgi:hypothetical protein